MSAGTVPQYLDSDSWSVSNPSGSVKVVGHVPGDLVTDMQLAGLVQDPLYELNFKATTWDESNFSYTLAFDLDAATASAPAVWLVFDGVKMAAEVRLNGHYLGDTTDQFVRYRFDVKTALVSSGNTLQVLFPPHMDARNNDGRSMGCSGGWDWGPYTTTTTAKESKEFTKGIWKSVYLLPVTTAAIEHLAPLVYYTGPYPTAPLTDATAGPWTVSVRVFLATPSIGGDVSGTLAVVGAWDNKVISKPVILPGNANTTVVVNMTVPVGGASLWWPNGMGAHTLYALNATFTPATGIPISMTRSMGFRVFTLVTGNDTNPSSLAGVDGSGSFTLRFRVNGANIWSRGSNFIPAEVLEGRQSALAYEKMVEAGSAAGYNTFRVWGGGIYPPEVFWEECDARGILVYMDYMYGRPWNGGNSGIPADTPAQEAEIRQQTRRLAAHPSLALWDSSNESGGGGLYASFIMATMVQEDPSRPPWPACPSTGWISGVDRLWGLPNGSPLGLQPHALAPTARGQPDMFSSGDPFAADSRRQLQAAPACNTKLEMETHGYYQHGEGFATVNSQAQLQPFSPNLPPALSAAYLTGPACKGTFASEFGASVASSFESMAPTLDQAHWGLHNAAMFERNYASDNFITAYFDVNWPGDFENNATGQAVFTKHLYCAQVAQALLVKSDISTRRSSNSFGTITWQHSEVWPTGGWGSLEYGTQSAFTKGQVIGGRWKPLHYFYAAHLYTDLFASCSADARCVVKNDNGLAAWAGSLRLSLLHVATGSTTTLVSVEVNLPRGSGSTQWACASATGNPFASCPPWSALLPGVQCASTGSDCVLLMDLIPTGSTVPAYSSFELLTTPKNMTLPDAVVVASVGSPNPDGVSVPITLTVTGGTALFVGLVTQAQGRFSANYGILPPGATTVTFLSFTPLDLPTLTSTLRVEHVAAYF